MNSPKTEVCSARSEPIKKSTNCLGMASGLRYRTSDDNEAVETVKIIDWEHPANNDFFLASQFWISGEYGRKRADLIGFVNGIPLLFIELKASHKHLENAYKLNLSDYRTTIPQVFWYNGVIILFERLEEQNRQYHRWLGTLLRVEEDQRRRRRG